MILKKKLNTLNSVKSCNCLGKIRIFFFPGSTSYTPAYPKSRTT